MHDHITLPPLPFIVSDIELALQRIARLEVENAELKRQAAEMAEELLILKARRYGRKSEKLTGEEVKQGWLFNEAETLADAPETATELETVKVTRTVYMRRKRGRKPLNPKLARVEVIVDLSEEEKAVEPGYELVRIGEETGEQVHEVPQKYLVIRTVRPKYVKRRMAGVPVENRDVPVPEFRIAPVPPRILPRSIATPSLLSSVLTGKFCDGLPFTRQEKIFERHGLEISRQDMANWAIAVAMELVQLIAKLYVLHPRLWAMPDFPLSPCPGHSGG